MRTYDDLSDIQLQLLKRGTIDLTGEVDRSMFNYCREAMVRLVAAGAPPCHILINSCGGSVKLGLNIYDLIDHYPGKTSGIVLSYSHSIAAVLLQACQKRLITKNSFLLIHNPGLRDTTWDEIFDPKENRRVKKLLKEARTKIIDILMERTGKSEAKIITALNNDKEMTALEALRFGLVDEISQPERITNDKVS